MELLNNWRSVCGISWLHAVSRAFLISMRNLQLPCLATVEEEAIARSEHESYLWHLVDYTTKLYMRGRETKLGPSAGVRRTPKDVARWGPQSAAPIEQRRGIVGTARSCVSSFPRPSSRAYMNLLSECLER